MNFINPEGKLFGHLFTKSFPVVSLYVCQFPDGGETKPLGNMTSSLASAQPPQPLFELLWAQTAALVSHSGQCSALENWKR